jgi:4-aminobutyrate--pyruvate transaminase
VGAAVALEALSIYEEMDLPAHVRRMSRYLEEKLAFLDAHPFVGDVRISGLMAGVEFVTDTVLGGSFARKVAEVAEERGVLYRVIDNVLAISPPLNVVEAELDQIAHILRESIESVVLQ